MTARLNKNYPFLINKGLSLLKFRIYKLLSGLERVYKLRRDMADNMVKVLSVLLVHTSLQHKGATAFVNIHTMTAQPLVVDLIAKEAGLSKRTTERALERIQSLGLLDVGRQYVRRSAEKYGWGLAVTSKVRSLSLKFWDILGLAGEFVQACKEAPKTLQFITPYHLIKNALRPRAQRRAPAAHPAKPIQQQLLEMMALFQAK